MRTLFFDCFSGISGDMTLGALLDVSRAKDDFMEDLDKLSIRDEFDIKIESASKMGIGGTSVEVIVKNKNQQHRSYNDIVDIINASTFEESIKQIALGILKTLANAEAKVHGTTIEEVHLHEVGAVDSIVDIVGTAILFFIIKPELIVCSPVNLGSGFVTCEHGTFPVPAPAVSEIMQGFKVYSKGEGEKTTPTGAAILKTFSYCAMELPEIIVESTGYGIGKNDFDTPNVLRVFMGEVAEDVKNEKVAVIETNVDDMSGESLGFCMDILLKAGALDVFYTPIYMKKNRPAYKITVICPQSARTTFELLLLENTSSIGVRTSIMERNILERKEITADTAYGPIRIKKSYGNGIEKYKPEYEDVIKVACEYDMPFDEASRNILNVIDYDSLDSAEE